MKFLAAYLGVFFFAAGAAYAAPAEVNISTAAAKSLRLAPGKYRRAFPVTGDAVLAFDAKGPGSVKLEMRADSASVGQQIEVTLRRDGEYVSRNTVTLTRARKGRRNVRARALLFAEVPEGDHRYEVAATGDQIFVAVGPVARAGEPMAAAEVGPPPKEEPIPEPPAAPPPVAVQSEAAPASPAKGPEEPVRPPEPPVTEKKGASSALDAATLQELAALPPLPERDVGDDVLLYEHTYNIGVGTGGPPMLVAPKSVPMPLRDEAIRLHERCAADATCVQTCILPNSRNDFDNEAFADCSRQYFGGVPDAAEPAPDAITLGVKSGDFYSRVPLFANARYRLHMEGTRWAYDVQAGVDGRFSSETGPDDDAALDFGGRTLSGLYKYFLDPKGRPFYGFGQLGASGAQVTWRDDRDSVWMLPLRITAGVGLGRAYSIEPLIRVAKIERTLRQVGALDGPIPPAVAAKIVWAWWELKNRIGQQEQLLYTLKILHEEGLLKGGVDQAAVYAMGRSLRESQYIGRRKGRDTRLGLRTGAALSSAGERMWTWVLQAEHEEVINVSLDADLTLTPLIAVALRDDDVGDNVAPGHFLPFSGLLQKRCLLSLPARYRIFAYDDVYNRTGALALRASLGFADGAGSRAAAVGVGSDYSIFWNARTALTVGVDVNLGYDSAIDDALYGVTGFLRLDYGQAEAVYAKPELFADKLPFELPAIIPQSAD